MFFKKKTRHVHLPVATIDRFKEATALNPDRITIEKVDSLAVHALIAMARERMPVDIGADGQGATMVIGGTE